MNDVRHKLIELGYQLVHLYGEGRYRQAIPIAQQARDLAQQYLGEHDPELATALNNLGGLYEAVGEYRQAEQMYLQAQQIYRLAPEEHALQLAGSLNDLAFLYSSMGNYPAAISLYHQALDTWPTNVAGAQLAVAQTKNNLALLYQAMGNYRAVEPLLEEVLNIRRAAAGDKHPAVAASLNNLAELYRILGRYTEAEPLYNEALAIQRTTLDEQHPDVANTLNNLAAQCRATRNYDDAVSLYHAAIAIWRATLGEQHPTVATALNNLAVLYKVMGNYSAAEPLFEQALDVRRKRLGENHPDVATSLHNLAGLYVATGRLHDAFRLMQESAAITDQLIGQIFSISSDRQRMAYLTSLKGMFDAFLSLVYHHLSYDSTAVEAALTLVLRRKAIAAEALAVQQNTLLGGRYPNLLPQLDRLTALCRQLGQKMLAGPGVEGSSAYRQLLTQWDAEREQLEAELAQHIPELNLTQRLRGVSMQDISAALPSDVALVEFIRFDVVDSQAIPSTGEPYWKPARYLAFVVSDDVQMLDLGEAKPIDDLIDLFRASITGRPTQVGEQTEAIITSQADQRNDEPTGLRSAILGTVRDLTGEWGEPDHQAVETVGQRLSAAVFNPLVASLAGHMRLFLAPDGDLHRLPFEVLPLHDGRRLIEVYHISYLSTGRDVLRFETQASGQGTLPLVAADPDFDLGTASGRPVGPFHRLPGTRREGEQVARCLGVTPVVAEAVLDTRLKQEMARGHSPRILHLATHGFFLSARSPAPPSLFPSDGLGDEVRSGLERLAGQHIPNPLLQSMLILAGVNTWLQGGVPPTEAEDGLLTAEDVTGLDLLNTDLVVLSACDTGLGQIQVGEGVFGLRRAFVLAGAKTLVMSLWKVPDRQTQELMELFYHHILDGMPRAAALRSAQLTLQTRYANPLFWGAFICQGDLGPLPVAPKQPEQ